MRGIDAPRPARMHTYPVKARNRQPFSPVRSILRFIFFGGLVATILAGIAVGSISLAIYHQSRNDETAPADAIVVLGAAHWNGRPSNTFQARLDHAHDLYVNGYAPLIVLTGGRAEGDQFSESEVGRTYLVQRGVPEHAMLTAGGMTSWESMSDAAPLLNERSSEELLLVSDPFHMFRVKRMASDLGFSPLASPTRTSPIQPSSPLEYRYMAREVGAYLAYLFTQH